MFFFIAEESKCSELDISQAIKMPPMPGQSRSLLHFAPVKQEFEGCPANGGAVKTEEPLAVAANAAAAKQPPQDSNNKSAAGGAPATVLRAGVKRPSPSSSPDHDYFGENKKNILKDVKSVTREVILPRHRKERVEQRVAVAVIQLKSSV